MKMIPSNLILYFFLTLAGALTVNVVNVLFTTATISYAQENNETQINQHKNLPDQLRQEIKSLRDELELKGLIGKTNSPFQELSGLRLQLAKFGAQIQQFEEEIRALRGDIDLIQHDIANKHDATTTRLTSIESSTMKLLNNEQIQHNIVKKTRSQLEIINIKLLEFENELNQLGIVTNTQLPPSQPEDPSVDAQIIPSTTTSPLVDGKSVSSSLITTSQDNADHNIVSNSQTTEQVIGTIGLSDSTVLVLGSIPSDVVEKSIPSSILQNPAIDQSNGQPNSDAIEQSFENTNNQQQLKPSLNDNALVSAQNNDAALQNTNQEAEALFKKSYLILKEASSKQTVDSDMYDNAIRGFNAFLQKYPDHELADDSAIWKAEALLAKGDFRQAMIAFNYVATHYAKSEKTGQALFKLAQGLEKNNFLEESCSVYRIIYIKYSDIDPRSAALARRAEQDKCK